MFRKIYIQLICITKTRNGIDSPWLKATTAGKAWYFCERIDNWYNNKQVKLFLTPEFYNSRNLNGLWVKIFSWRLNNALISYFLWICFSRRKLRTKDHASLQLISNKIQIIRFYLSLVRSVAYGESEVKLFVCKEIINRW
jgi:hypothetical protein